MTNSPHGRSSRLAPVWGPYRCVRSAGKICSDQEGGEAGRAHPIGGQGLPAQFRHGRRLCRGFAIRPVAAAPFAGTRWILWRRVNGRRRGVHNRSSRPRMDEGDLGRGRGLERRRPLARRIPSGTGRRWRKSSLVPPDLPASLGWLHRRGGTPDSTRAAAAKTAGRDASNTEIFSDS